VLLIRDLRTDKSFSLLHFSALLGAAELTTSVQHCGIDQLGLMRKSHMLPKYSIIFLLRFLGSENASYLLLSVTKKSPNFIHNSPKKVTYSGFHYFTIF
jgi:hypothetical protein